MEIKILPYSPNMMFSEYIFGCHQEPEFVIGPHGELRITGVSIVKNETLDDARKTINKKYGLEEKNE